MIGVRVCHRKTFLVCPSINNISGKKHARRHAPRDESPRRRTGLFSAERRVRRAQDVSFSGISSEYQNAIPGKSCVDNNRRGDTPYRSDHVPLSCNGRRWRDFSRELLAQSVIDAAGFRPEPYAECRGAIASKRSRGVSLDQGALNVE